MTDLTDQQVESALAPCGSCDAGLPMNCTCVDLRPVVSSLLARAQKAEAEADDLRVRYEGRKADWKTALGERDALAARLASAEAKLAKVEKLCDEDWHRAMPGYLLVKDVRAELAADTTPEPTEDDTHCVRPNDHDGDCETAFERAASKAEVPDLMEALQRSFGLIPRSAIPEPTEPDGWAMRALPVRPYRRGGEER